MASATTLSTTGARKAAIFLMGVGETISGEVLRQLLPDEVRRITAEISATPAVVSDQLITVFREFEARAAEEGRLFAVGGAECAKRLVEHAFGADAAQKVLPSASGSSDRGATALLEEADPQQLAVLLRNEQPQAIAVLLCNLPAQTAANLLGSLPVEAQKQIALRMAHLDRVSPDALQKISEAVRQKVKNMRKMDRPDGIRALAALLKCVPGGQADMLIGSVQEQDERLAADVRNRMFVFEDILPIGAEGMKALVARIDRKVLTLALKGTSANVRAHFTQQMSQRASEMLTEDMEALGPVRVQDVKTAQSEIIAVVRTLQQEGALSTGGGEEYVD